MVLAAAKWWMVAVLSVAIASPLAEPNQEDVASAENVIAKRDSFTQGQPISSNGRGAPILGK